MEAGMKNAGRELWRSKFGFVLAAAGSAIGLGNFWRFPYMTGENGGAVFVLIYLCCVLLVGFPIMLAELAIGRRTQKNPVGAFILLAPRSAWKFVGVLGVLAGIGILSFYGSVAGWTIAYFIKTIAGDFSTLTDAARTKEIFEEFVADPFLSIFYLFLFLGINGAVVLKGVEKGIERAAKILMPILLIILVLLAIRSVTLQGASKGLIFYLYPDFGKVTGWTLVNGLGQALFSLSLGMGTMITYGSYLSKKENLAHAAGYVCLFDSLIALISGFAIFPALFAMGLQPDQGPGLVFVVLPSIFDSIPGGMVFGMGFFLILSIAALTSTVSLLEVVVAYFIDEKGWTRRRAAVVGSIAAFLLGIPSALSTGCVDFLTVLPGLGTNFLDVMDALFGSYALAIGSFFIALFVGWKWGVGNAAEEVRVDEKPFPLERLWKALISYVAPVCVGIIILNMLREYFF